MAEQLPHTNGELYDRRVEDRRRVDVLEKRVASNEISHVRLKQRVEMLIATVNSRHDALEGGQTRLDSDIAELRTYKDRVLGAFWLIALLGVTGLIGGVISIIKAVKGP